MPKRTSVDISTFTRSSAFYPAIPLILTVKSFDLQAIRKRYLASKTNKSGKAGSVERRKPSEGGIASLTLSAGQLQHETILCRTAEPRGIDSNDQYLGIANEQAVYIIDQVGSCTTLQNPWFSYIHTVQFHPKKQNHILISSSGFDLIQEYNFKTKELDFEWLAWEHGFDTAHDPKTGKNLHLTRNTTYAEQLKKKGENYLLIEQPSTDTLPTANRAAFINSVTYHPAKPELLLATFFHEGKVYQIDKVSGKAKAVLTGLKNPHGGHIHHQEIIATSTGTGEIIVKKGDSVTAFSTANLPGKPPELGKMEWVQNTLSTKEYLIAIDSNRTSFIIIHPQKKMYDIISYNNNWAVQDMISGTPTPAQINALQELR